MENRSSTHTLWEERIVKKHNQNEGIEPVFKTPQDEKPKKRGGSGKIFLALFFLFLLLAVIYISRVFLQNEKEGQSSDTNVTKKQGEKPSLLGKLINAYKNFSIFQIISNGEIQRLELGSEESIPMSILKYVPDGHISKIEKDGKITLFISAHDKSYLMQGETLINMVLLTDSNNLPKPILKPESSGFDKDYAGFGQIIENPKTRDLIGIYHTEIRVNPNASDSQLTSIALALSKDNGFTWEKKGRIITGQNIATVGTIVSGAGQPSGVIVGDYIYLYFSDWNRLMPDSIHLARALISSNGMPGTWEKYTENGFLNVGLGGKSIPVIMPFEWNKKIYYTANPSVSFNEHLRKYLAVFETNIGFFAAVSTDGINWGSYKMIFEFPADTTVSKNIGDIWFSYPTLLSEKTPTDMITGKTGYFYYSRGIFGQDHQLVRRAFVIK